MEEYKYDVFISYSRKDTTVADKICDAFDKAGITYFIDRQGVGGGMEFPIVISQAIRESKVFLFLASKNSYDSKFTQSEIVYAFNKKQKQDIIPYIIDGSDLPEELAFTFSAINWRNIDQHPIDTVLLNDVLEKLGKETQPIPTNPKKRKFSGKTLAWIVLGFSATYFSFASILIIFASDSVIARFVDFSFVLVFFAFILMLIGFIRPKSLDLRTRKEVAKFYLSSFVILFFAAALLSPDDEYAQVNVQQEIRTETTVTP